MALILVTGLAALLFLPSSSFGQLAFPPHAVELEALDGEGRADLQAGSHPDLLVATVHMTLGKERGEGPRGFAIEFPPGFGGDANAVPPCPRSIASGPFFHCPPQSRVGTFIAAEDTANPTSLFLIQPRADEAISMGGWDLAVPIAMAGHLRPQDQGLSLEVDDIPEAFGSIEVVRVELFGVPADHQEGTSIARRGLLTLPTECGKPLTATVRMRSWSEPERWLTTEASTDQPLRGCADLPFDPGLAIALDHPVADSPTGARIELKLPQATAANQLATAGLREATISLPEGVTISPAAAQGLLACSDEQLGRGKAGAPTCPPASQIGTAKLEGPQLREPLSGRVYLGQELPGDRFRLFVYAAGAGAEAKIVGSLHPDSRTGRLTASLADLPAAGFETMSLELEGGSDALLATPLECGQAAVSATFTPSSGTPPVTRSGAVAIGGRGGSGCGKAPFSPTLAAGSANPRAGGSTSFQVKVGRADGEQLPSRVAISLPEGMSATLRGVGRCGDDQAAAGDCPASSRIGRAVVELGPGAKTSGLEGSIYLTGPYRGAPFGVALAFPAKIGPFDLGTMAVRGTVRVDRLSGRVKIETDPLPRLFEGTAMRFQSIGLAIDRPGFIHNPTSCAPRAVTATVTSTAGAVAQLSRPYRAPGCVSLPFRPRFSAAVSGGSKRGQRPSLKIAARVPGGGSNLRAATFALPRPLTFDPAGLGALCGTGAAQEGSCPAGAAVGTAQARSPLIETPLRGEVFATRPKQGHLPDLWISLSGGGLDVALRVDTGESHGRAKASLREVPDMPISSLRMTLHGGRDGLLSLRRNLCGARRLQVAADVEGQNRILLHQRLPLRTGSKCD
ncbi:MAG: hypothetical protein ACTHNY_07540 [Solirubrobacterales bacterium]